MGIREWLFGDRDTTEVAHAEPIAASQPRKKTAQRRYRVVDVEGSWDRKVVGNDHFPGVVDSIPLGPVKVTLALKPNEANPHAVAAFVGGQQVGWLSTDWSPKDEWVQWMRHLDAANIRPRFNGECRLTEVTKTRQINFDVPGRADESLSVIADRLIGG